MVRTVLISVCVGMFGAAPCMAQTFERGWVDINFGVAAAAEKEFTSAQTFTVSQETGAGAVAYSLPQGGSFDVGGGYMFNRHVGVGVTLAGTAHEDVAGLALTIPHPLRFNASATDATVTNGTLARAEGAWHIGVFLVAAETPRLRFRVFGGPSYFRAEQDVISNIKYDQTYQVFGTGNVIDITSYETKTSVGTAWGFHGGLDLAVFFNRIVGIGAVLRVSRGTAEIADYGGTHNIKTGGTQFGAGLRLKF